MSADDRDDERARVPDPLGLDEDAGASAAPGQPGSAGADAGPPPAAVPPASRPRGGRLLGVLSLLVALAALSAAGYLYYELMERRDVPALAGRVDALQADVDAEVAGLEGRLDARLGALADRQREALDTFRQRQDAARRDAEQALRESLAALARQEPPSSGEWRRAEAQYLLRIANQRLLMERDVTGALSLLRAADTALAALDDYALHDVRSRLADEIAALERVEDVDFEGLFLRLEAAKRDVDELPLRVPEYAPGGHDEPPEPTAGASDSGFWAVLRQQLTGLLRVRHLEGDVKPLLAPDEGVYLQLNLQLMLERAQLAAIDRNQLVFEQSLGSAADWIRRYMDVDKPAVRGLLDELTALRAIDLQPPLPDISGSLNALTSARSGPE